MRCRRVEVKDKRTVKATWEPPSDAPFHTPRFECDRAVDLMLSYWNPRELRELVTTFGEVA